MKPAARLLAWYRVHGRTLPWRATRNPYKILVSEIMLQQTQVERVKLFYKAWLAEFPTWQALAKASNAEVLRAWAGLGYNRRALMLRDVAKHIATHGEPRTQEAWQSIKGIGPYTSAAIMAFAYKERVLPIDTNIRRVLGRLLLGVPFPGFEHDEAIARQADAFLPKKGAFYDVPQALFDVATMHCTKIPDCAHCPMRAVCPSASGFLSGAYPTPKTMVKKAKETRHRNKPHPDRIYRGRILACVRTETSVSLNELGAQIDPIYDDRHDRAWVEAMVDRMVRDHLITKQGSRVSLYV